MHTLNLTDGTTTITLNDGTTSWTTSYSMASPSPGGSSCTDQVQLILINTYSKLRAIEGMFTRAAIRARTRSGPRVYLTLQLHVDSIAPSRDETQVWRSEIQQGQLVADQVVDAYHLGAMEVVLIIQRAPYWEGVEVEIPLFITGEEDAVGGMIIHNDPELGNHVSISALEIQGSIPAPVRLRFIHETGTGWYKVIYLANNVSVLPHEAVLFVQAEDEERGLGVDGVSASCSGGYQWTSETFGTTEEMLGVWPLDENLAENSGGRWWRLLARITGYDYDDLPVLKPVILDNYGLSTLWTGTEVRPEAGAVYGLVDLGPIPIPPGPWTTGYGKPKIGLIGSSPVDTTISIDYFQLLPMDSLRKIDQTAYGLAAGEWDEVDEIEKIYCLEDANGKIPVLIPSEGPLMVWPLVEQRIHVVNRETYSSKMDTEVKIQMWYRPRRLTL